MRYARSLARWVLVALVLSGAPAGAEGLDPRWSNAVALDDGWLFVVGVERFWLERNGVKEPLAAPAEAGDHGGHNLSVRLDAGHVLVVEAWSGSAFLYDIAGRSFTPAARLPVRESTFPFATRLSDGRVLAVGWRKGALYDPKTAAWIELGELAADSHAATALSGDRVLLSGGNVDQPPDEFLAGLGVKRRPGSTNDALVIAFDQAGAHKTRFALHDRREQHSATALEDGTVLIAGGRQVTADMSCFDMHHAVFTCSGKALATVELFDPATGRSVVAPPMQLARGGHAALRLPDGRVLVMGGQDTQLNKLGSVEIYDPVKRRWASAPSLKRPRGYATPVAIGNDKLLVGGFDGPEEIYVVPPITTSGRGN